VDPETIEIVKKVKVRVTSSVVSAAMTALLFPNRIRVSLNRSGTQLCFRNDWSEEEMPRVPSLRTAINLTEYHAGRLVRQLNKKPSTN
jgi:hypothetical protein